MLLYIIVDQTFQWDVQSDTVALGFNSLASNIREDHQLLLRQVSLITTEYLREYDTYDSMMLLFPKEMPFEKKNVCSLFFIQTNFGFTAI